VAVTMGVNVAGGTAFVALVEDSQLLDKPPYILAPSEIHGAVAGLSKFEEDVSRQLNLWDVRKLVVLEPETSYKAPYSGFVDRIGVESRQAGRPSATPGDRPAPRRAYGSGG